MAGVEGNHQVGGQMVVADLRGAVPGRVPGGLEDLVRARVRPVTDVVAVGARTGDPDPVTEASRRTCSAKMRSAIGERQMFPVHTKVT